MEHLLGQQLREEKTETTRLREALALAEKNLKTKDTEIERWKNAHGDTEGELMEALDNLHNAEVDLEVAEEELSIETARMVDRERKLAELEEENKSLEESCAETKQWIGACLKFKFLASKIKELLPESAADDIIESFDYIEIPEVDEETRAEFVVTETSNSVVETSTLAEDREYYGDDFYLNEEDRIAETVVNSPQAGSEADLEDIVFGEPVEPEYQDAALAALQEGLEIDRLTNLLYELGIQTIVPTIREYEINSISEIREHLRMGWAPLEPGHSEEFGISEETLRILSEWNQSLTEQESVEIYNQMQDTLDDEQFQECLERNEWPPGAIQLTTKQFEQLQEWDSAHPNQDIHPRSFVIDMNSIDYSELPDCDHCECCECCEEPIYDDKVISAVLVFQKMYREKKKLESARRIQKCFRNFLVRKERMGGRRRMVWNLRVRRRLNYAE